MQMLSDDKLRGWVWYSESMLQSKDDLHCLSEVNVGASASYSWAVHAVIVEHTVSLVGVAAADRY